MIPFKLGNQHREIGSPSVNLEKGRYRMRGPVSSSNAVQSVGPDTSPDVNPLLKRKRAQSNPNTTVSTFMATMVVLLITACLTSFGFAYYLYTTRWDSATLPHDYPPTDELAFPTSHPSPSGHLLTNQVVHFDPELADIDAYYTRNDTSEKFLSYLPHSGFHNQRIAFENALTLARLLNRTLLVPPVRLGRPPIHYMSFVTLRRVLSLSSKDGLHHCSRVYHFVPLECFDFFDHTLVPWGWLVDLSAIRKRQHLIQRWDLSDKWLLDHLHINHTDGRDSHAIYTDVYAAGDDTYTLADIAKYQYRFTDTQPSDVPSSPHATIKYREYIHIDTLSRQSADRSLLQLGTLFGSSRLKLQNRANRKLRGSIRTSMIPAIPQVHRVSEEIKRHLSVLSEENGNSNGNYLGAHVRTGDGVFKAGSQANARIVCLNLMRTVLGFTEDDEDEFASSLENLRISRHEEPARQPSIGPGGQLNRLECWLPKYTDERFAPLNIPLFISTDAQDPRHNPLMKDLVQTFPCTFFLSDFLTDQRGQGTTLVNDTLRLTSGYDGIPLRDHLIPFVDAVVVSWAWMVVGTEGSTFSSFILDVLWRVHHGLEIRQRG